MGVTRKPIPVNIIAGPLGVGKTTGINHLLSLRPDHERWAVLVNEYGLVGLDAALMQPSSSDQERPGVEIKEVAGGCICCSAGFMFEVSLVLLLQRRPDRLLIEPTGLAAVSGILDTLDRKGIREAVDVRSVICLLDPANRESALERDVVQDQVEAADVLLANRADLATPEAREDFVAWAETLFPPKRRIAVIEQGRIPIEALDCVSKREFPAHRGGHAHGTDHHEGDPHDHHHDHHHHHHDADASPATDVKCDVNQPIVSHVHRSSTASTIGWVCWDELIFDAQKTASLLSSFSRLPGNLRTKAALRTTEGWLGYNFVDDVQTVRPNGHRRDSRLELIVEGSDFPTVNTLEAMLRDCIVESQTQSPPSPPVV